MHANSLQNSALIGLVATLFCAAHLAADDELAVDVSPSDELTILDPRTNAEGKPQPRLFMDANGEQQVDIPPTVIVHNYYYSGDRNFRGPRLPGGPSILVVRHPVTKERQYLEVEMLPGSPRITYRKAYIDYNFGARSIRVRFIDCYSVCDRHAARVEYDDGEPEDLDPRTTQVGHVRDWIRRTGLPHAVKHVAHGTHGALDSAADRIHHVGEVMVAPVVVIFDSTPLGGLVSDSDVERATSARDAAVERTAERVRREQESIPTLR